MFPTMLMGHTGSFPGPNYGAPYLVSPLHGYNPALNSYDNSNELGSSRPPNLPGGSLPLYDPTNISGNGKYSIPGLGDMSGLGAMQTGGAKDGLQVNGGDLDKGNGLGTSGLGNGMDALPYMINHGYPPSMQYPMYTFPTPPYGPPGMAPAGPSPFPYAAGQVSSQGGRGDFGFNEGNVGISVGGNASGGRNGGGLGAESMYASGTYLNNSMSHNSNSKGGSDGTYKSVRGGNAGSGGNNGANSGGGSGAANGAGGAGGTNGGSGAGAGAGSGLGSMGMGGGMVGSMGGYDYNGGSGGNGVAGNNMGGGWGNRGQGGAGGNGMRMDGSVSAGMMSNGGMGAGGGSHAGPASSGYVDAGAGGSNAYWTPQSQQGQHYY